MTSKLIIACTTQMKVLRPRQQESLSSHFDPLPSLGFIYIYGEYSCATNVPHIYIYIYIWNLKPPYSHSNSNKARTRTLFQSLINSLQVPLGPLRRKGPHSSHSSFFIIHTRTSTTLISLKSRKDRNESISELQLSFLFFKISYNYEKHKNVLHSILFENEWKFWYSSWSDLIYVRPLESCCDPGPGSGPTSNNNNKHT